MKQIEEYIEALVTVPYKRSLESLDSYDGRFARFVEERPKELAPFKAHLKKINAFKGIVDGLKFEFNLEVVRAVIMDDFGKEQDAWLGEQESTISDLDEQVSTLKAKIEAENKAHNERLVQANRAGNMGFEALEAKRKQLESYSDKIFDMCSQYGITTTDMNIDESMFSMEELNRLYDDYLAYMEKENKGTNIVSKFRSKVSDTTAQGVVLLILIIACFTPVLDIVSIGFFLALAGNQIASVNRYKYYTILLAIVYNVKPENMGFEALDMSQMLPEELTSEMMDTDERFAKFEQMYIDALEKYEGSGPAVEQARFMSEWSQKMAANQEMLNGYAEDYMSRVNRLREDVVKELEFLASEYERLKSEFKFIGNRWSKHFTFEGKYALGLHDDCIEETVVTGDKNIVIRPCPDVSLMNKFLQAMFVNAVGNVCPGKLKTIIYDPNNFGRSLMPLYSNDLKESIEFYNSDLGPIIDELADYAQNNFKEMAGKTIHEFNSKCEEVGITPIDYRLLIILSQPKTVEEDEKLQSFLEYSATGGVYIWIVSESITPKDAFIFNRPFEGVQTPITAMITDDWCRDVSQKYLDAIADSKPKGLLWADFIDNVWPIDKTWTGDATKFIDFYPGYHNGDPTLYRPYTLGNEGNVHAIGVGTSGAGKSVFLNHLIGTMCRKYSPWQLELWLCDFKGVEFKSYMHSSRPKAARLCKPAPVVGDDRPSVTDEEREVFGYYSYNEETGEYTFSEEPTEVCKELHKFKQAMKNGKPKQKNGKDVMPVPKADLNYEKNMESYSLPHISACLCTSDGDFATSLFKAFRTKAERRYDDLGFIGVKNMPGWNNKVKGLIGTRKPDKMIEVHTKQWKETDFNPVWSEADLWPRILFVCDEFQVIFQKASPQNVEKIKGDITYIAKVARACGMHIFFTSQSMKGTVSTDILANFTLRFALRCEAEVSQDIIGSKKAAEIREKNGYLIVQSQEMKTPEDQKKYKTPFLCDDPGSGKYTESELFDNIRDLYLRSVEQKFPHRDVISYEEKTTHPISELVELYDRLDKEGRRPKSGVFFLGNRMAYSANRAPDNIIMDARNNTNMMAVFSDTTDFVQFFKGLITNIHQNQVPGTIIINSQVADLAYVTEAEDCITYPEKHGRLLSEKVSCVEFITWCERLCEARISSGKREVPVWIFMLGWDKGKGYAIEADTVKRSKLVALMQTAGEYNIHFIQINTSMTGINAAVTGACKFRIAGKCSADESTVTIGTKQAGMSYEIATGWQFSWNNGVVTRDKLWVSPITREIAETEIIL